MPDDRQSGGGAGRYFGKYRGKVIENFDPSGRGRLQVIAPEALGENVPVWALPCVPFAGRGIGFYAIPPVGANVWVEFEAGDLDHPIWTGCFWNEGDLARFDTDPQIFFYRTQKAAISIDDALGEITIETQSSKITLNGTQVIIEAPVVINDTGNGGKTELSAAGFDAQQGALKVI